MVGVGLVEGGGGVSDWLLHAFSQGLGPRQLERLNCLRLNGPTVFPIWGRQFRRKYLETKYSASSVAGVLKVSSLIRSTPIKSPVPLKEVTSLQSWSLPPSALASATPFTLESDPGVG